MNDPITAVECKDTANAPSRSGCDDTMQSGSFSEEIQDGGGHMGMLRLCLLLSTSAHLAAAYEIANLYKRGMQLAIPVMALMPGIFLVLLLPTLISLLLFRNKRPEAIALSLLLLAAISFLSCIAAKVLTLLWFGCNS